MGAPTILLVEGKQSQDDSLQAAINREGYQLYVAHSAQNATLLVRQHLPDLIIYHAASMRSDGVVGCLELRRQVGSVPIIHTRKNGVAKDERAGADVYLMKPFTARKVLNRVRALLPSDQFTEEIIRAEDLTLFRGKPSVDVPLLGENRLTPKQAHLLETFLRNPNQVLDRRQLMKEVWETDYIGDTRTLDVHIRWLREAIEENPSKPCRVVTVRGVGYIFKCPSRSG